MDVLPERFPGSAFTVTDPNDNLIFLSKRGRREQFPMVSAGKGEFMCAPLRAVFALRCFFRSPSSTGV